MPGGIPGGLKRDNGKGRTGLECEVLAYNQLIASYSFLYMLMSSHIFSSHLCMYFLMLYLFFHDSHVSAKHLRLEVACSLP